MNTLAANARLGPRGRLRRSTGGGGRDPVPARCWLSAVVAVASAVNSAGRSDPPGAVGWSILRSSNALTQPTALWTSTVATGSRWSSACHSPGSLLGPTSRFAAAAGASSRCRWCAAGGRRVALLLASAATASSAISDQWFGVTIPFGDRGHHGRDVRRDAVPDRHGRGRAAFGGPGLRPRPSGRPDDGVPANHHAVDRALARRVRFCAGARALGEPGRRSPRRQLRGAPDDADRRLLRSRATGRAILTSCCCWSPSSCLSP